MNAYIDFYQKAMKILDDLNELISDISWYECENEDYDEVVTGMLSTLRYAIEDTEAELSNNLYDSQLQELYEELTREEETL